MPEKKPDEKNTKEDENKDRRDEEKSKSTLDLRLEKMRLSLRNFFSFSLSVMNEFRKEYFGKKSSVNNKLIRSNPLRLSFNKKECKESHETSENRKNETCMGESMLQQNNKKPAKLTNLSRDSKFDGSSLVIKNEFQSKDNRAGIACKEDKPLNEVFDEKNKESKTTVDKNAATIQTPNRSITAEEINSENPKCTPTECQCEDIVMLKAETRRISKKRTEVAERARNIRYQRLQSENDAVQSEENTNKADQNKVSRKVLSNPDLMSGSEVIAGEFAEEIKITNFYTSEPIIPDDRHFYKSCSIGKASSETFIFSKALSGGTVVDKSSFGANLPELCPLKREDLPKRSLKIRISRGKNAKSRSSVTKSDISSENLANRLSSGSDDVFSSKKLCTDVAAKSTDVAAKSTDVAAKSTDVAHDAMAVEDSAHSTLQAKNDKSETSSTDVCNTKKPSNSSEK